LELGTPARDKTESDRLLEHDGTKLVLHRSRTSASSWQPVLITWQARKWNSLRMLRE